MRLTSVCTVFVESDIMSYLAQRKTVEDILGGVHKAIATRTMSLVRRVGVEDEVTFTGGVSRNIGMVRALEEVLGRAHQRERRRATSWARSAPRSSRWSARRRGPAASAVAAGAGRS